MTSLPLPHAARRALPIAALLLTVATAAQAQGTDAQREACTPDALKLCSDTIPDIPKTTACMKAHEAALSARCRAVFDAPSLKGPVVTTVSRADEAHREKHARRDAARAEPATPALLHRLAGREDYADPLGAAGDDVYGGPEQAFAPSQPDTAPDIRHFAPGDVPDEADASGPSPYGYDGGPRYLGPGAWQGRRGWEAPPEGDGWDRPHLAVRDGFDEPRPRGSGRLDVDGPPGFDRDDGPIVDTRRPRRAARPARTVIARLCARGEIDAHTCAVTERALRRAGRD